MPVFAAYNPDALNPLASWMKANDIYVAGNAVFIWNEIGR